MCILLKTDINKGALCSVNMEFLFNLPVKQCPVNTKETDFSAMTKLIPVRGDSGNIFFIMSYHRPGTQRMLEGTVSVSLVLYPEWWVIVGYHTMTPSSFYDNPKKEVFFSSFNQSFH